MKKITKQCRLYPNKEMGAALDKYFGCCRFVWNSLLEETYHYTGIINQPYLNSLLTELKTKHDFLKDCSSVALQQVTFNLASAWSAFFNNTAQKPKFKSRKMGHNSFKLVGSCVNGIGEKYVHFPKIGKCKYKNSWGNLSKVSSYVISKKRNGKYYISFLVEVELKPKTQSGMVGIDVGLSYFATCADNQGNHWKINNPKFLLKRQRAYKRASRRLSRKVLGSANRNKSRNRLAALVGKTVNQRNDYLHKVSTELVSKYQHIVIEDLNIRGLLKNNRLAKHISDTGWGEFFRQLHYKALMYNTPIHILKAPRWYPSTQICANCNSKREVRLHLNERSWTCNYCGASHDRDINAAQNLLKQVLSSR